MLQRYCGVGGDSDAGHGCSNWSGEIWELSMLVWLMGSADHVLGSWLRLHAECGLLLLRGVDWRVVGAELVIGHRGTRVHRVVGRRREFLVFKMAHIWHADEV